MRKRCVVLGGGGHAKVVIEAMAGGREFAPAAVTDPRRKGKVLGVPIAGGDDRLPALKRRGIGCFIVGVGGAADNRVRAAVYARGLEAGLRPALVIHTSAVVARSAELGPGTVVLPRGVVNPEAKLGKNVIVNTAAVVEHDAQVGDHAHVAPGAVVCGGAVLAEGVFVGAGAVVREGVRIGAWAVVAAGAVVVGDVRAGARVMGVPARPR